MSNQTAYEQNVLAIAQYFRDGIKPTAEKIGIELEHILVHTDGTPVNYSAPDGQRAILTRLQPTYPAEERDGQGNITLLSNGCANITLEPAAQTEISAGPFACLAEAEESIQAFEVAAAKAAGSSIEVLGIGYHPTTPAADLELIPKERYHIMNEYLGAISKFGICMMRGSAATQVSIDYTSEQDCLRKLRLSNALVPLLSLIADNSPVFEGELRTHQLVRTEIWEKCDPDRCGTVPGVMDQNFSFERYAEYILDTPAMVDISTGIMRLSHTPFKEIYAGRLMTVEDIEHALSVFFTDIRLKHYIEIRPADSLPPAYALSYAALIKGLFYGEHSLDELDSIFGGVRASDINLAKSALMQQGYDACVYDSPVSALMDQMISIAYEGLAESERSFLQPLEALVEKRTTLACLAIQNA